MKKADPNFRKQIDRNGLLSKDTSVCSQVTDAWVTRASDKTDRPDAEEVSKTMETVIACTLLFGDDPMDLNLGAAAPDAHEDFIQTGSGLVLQRRT